MFRFSIFFAILVFCTTSFAQDITQLGNIGSIVIVVSNEQAWTQTGILVEADDTVVVIVQGIAAANGYTVPNTTLWIGPEGMGAPNWITGSENPLPGASSFSVIGKIGSTGTPFYVGKNCSFTANINGELYLGINDQIFWDNYGYYVAFISKYHNGMTAVNDKTQSLPEKTSISQNYPNPFNPSTTIEYQIAKQGDVEVAIYDVNGRLVKTLLNSTQYPGSYTIRWNGQDEGNRTVASGTYFYQVKSNGIQLVKKMLLLK